MELEVHVEGDVVERTELLNGTRTIAIEGRSSNGAWVLSGVVSWNLGLVDYAGEGDASISGDEGEIYATLTSAAVMPTAEDDGDDRDVRLQIVYDVDGGVGRFSRVRGSINGDLAVKGDTFEGVWSGSLQE
jgi:hypothetical protein